MRTAEEMLAHAHAATNRRLRVCSKAPRCPVCLTRQVQIIDCAPLATWKCRECKHKWRYEPVIDKTKGEF